MLKGWRGQANVTVISKTLLSCNFTVNWYVILLTCTYFL
jgi:hypothetical protein